MPIYERKLTPFSKKLAPFSVLLKNSQPEKNKIKTKPYFFGITYYKKNFGNKVLQNFKIILHVEVFISLYFFICMAVSLMCLQREGSGKEIVNFVMQANARVDFKNILLNFSEKKFF